MVGSCATVRRELGQALTGAALSSCLVCRSPSWPESDGTRSLRNTISMSGTHLYFS